MFIIHYSSNKYMQHVCLQLNSPSQRGELELLHTVKQEALQVCLADASYWVDVCTGAVVLCEVSCETEQEKAFNGSKVRLHEEKQHESVRRSHFNIWWHRSNRKQRCWGAVMMEGKLFQVLVSQWKKDLMSGLSSRNTSSVERFTAVWTPLLTCYLEDGRWILFSLLIQLQFMLDCDWLLCRCGLWQS